MNAVPAGAHEADTELLERAPFLAALAESLEDAAGGSGRLVVVGGEAGVGKSALLRRFCAAHQDAARILSGACDALETPRALGPFLDVAEAVDDELRNALEQGGLHGALAALLAELRRAQPTIVVLEDVHWADEATLDLLRVLARRIESVATLVLVSFRDDELDRRHPLRVLLGELATSATLRRLQLTPLSLDAVATLAAPHGVDAEELFRATGGNPFFVTEVLGAGAGSIPHTVRDAVLARAARLSPAAYELLEAVAVAPSHAELWLLERLAGGDLARLDECLDVGMLHHDGRVVAFRHELARLAIEQTIPPLRGASLHRAAVRALADPPVGSPDPARLAHHADAAGDAEAVLEFAPAAAERASRLGAHREAAAQYARVLRFASRLPAEHRAELLDKCAYECYLTDQLEQALEVNRRRLELYTALGDRRREGDALRWVSRLLLFLERPAEADVAGLEAVRILEELEPGSELARAYNNVAQIRLLANDNTEAMEWASRALELGERIGDAATIAHALSNIGSAKLSSGLPGATADLLRSLRVAQNADLHEHVARPIDKLAYLALRRRDYAAADRYIADGLEYTSRHELEAWHAPLLTMKASSALGRGRWTEAAELAQTVLGRERLMSHNRLVALTLLARARTRLGDPGVAAALAEAHAIQHPPDDLDQIGPLALADADAALARGEPEAVGAATQQAFDVAAEREDRWWLGELACLRRRAGIHDELPAEVPALFAPELAGEYERAADAWAALGCPYEAALALAATEDDDNLRRALKQLQDLGARPAAAAVTRELRERAARGPRLSTRENPAELTAREVEVLTLVAQGLRNTDIAERLVVSERTVHHHVSAILRKLGVRSRAEASVAAVRLGLTPPR